MIDVKAIPDELKQGEAWPMLDLDPDWVWIVRDSEDNPCGILIAAPCHGLVFIWRIKILPAAPGWALGRLLRNFIRDLRRRGCLGYMAMLDVLNRPAEMALARIAFRAGASFTTATTVIYGSVAAKHVGDQ